MKTSILLLSVALATGAVAQTPPPPPMSQPPPPPAAAPPTAQPIEPPPVATSAPPPPGSVAGEWVYTTQYGWIWMPYAQQYTHVVEDSGAAYEFVYYPAFGWRWVVAPWVFGIGPAPHFVHGPGRFVWYAHPWFRAHPLVHREFHEHRR